MVRVRSLAVLALAAVAVGTGCKKEAPPPAPVAVDPAPPPPPLAVAGVDLGKSVDPSKRIASPTTTFGVRDTIYASVATVGAATSATLAARWTFESGQLVDSTSVTITPTGPAVTEFHIIKPTGWPVGKYKVSILLNGAQATEREFEIKRG